MDVSNLRYVLFDWDNTLAQTRPALVSSVNRVLSEYGLPDWDVSSAKRDKNLSFQDNFPNIFGADKAAAAYKRYCEVYLENGIPEVIATVGADKVLNFFRERKIVIMIVSNKDRRLLAAELPRLYNPHLFAEIVCGHEAPADKPSPQQIRYALRNYLRPEEISKENVWMIGDSRQDSDSAVAAGALPVRIGKSIWGDSGISDEHIVFYDDFSDFYETLIQSD